MSSALFVGSGNASAQALTPYAPNNAAIGYSDYCAVSVDASRARFVRPTVDGQGFEHANPGARVRFRTDANYIQVRLRYTNLVTRPDTYNGVGLVLADGVEVQQFNRAQGADGPLTFIITFATSVLRTIELLMPYCASVDLLGIDLPVGASISAAAARPATRYVAMGDSITHGFVASGVKSWAQRLAVAKNWQLINHGYGGRTAQASDGATLAALTPTVATYLIGYNNFYPQTPLATFKAEFKSFVQQFRLVNTTAKLYCITPIWTPNTFGALSIEDYRQQIRDALTELANPLNVLIEGLPLVTNSVSLIPDNVHPNDTGEAEMAAALGPLVSV